MNDEKIKELLTSYVAEEMSLLREEELPGYSYSGSGIYERWIRRMPRRENYSAGRLHLESVVRRTAAVAVVILSLFTVNEVSAGVFGFNPWKFATSFLSDGRMDVKTYTGQTDSFDDAAAAAVKRDVPSQIPDGFEKDVIQVDARVAYARWSCGEKDLRYQRIKITEGMSVAVDAEYQTKESVTINTFVGDYRVKGNSARLMWDDAEFNHLITVTDVDNPKEMLVEMAESLYR